MGKGMICILLVGRSAAFAAYSTPRSFLSSKTMPLKTNLHGLQQKSNSFGVPSPLCGELSFRNILQPVNV